MQSPMPYCLRTPEVAFVQEDQASARLDGRIIAARPMSAPVPKRLRRVRFRLGLPLAERLVRLGIVSPLIVAGGRESLCACYF